MMAVLQNRRPDGSKGQRREDRTFWAAFDYFTTKYKLLIWVLAWFLFGAGFGFKLPIQAINQTNAKIDSTERRLQIEIDDIKIDHKNIKPNIDAVKDDLNILLRLGCADKYTTSNDKYVSGLDCPPK